MVPSEWPTWFSWDVRLTEHLLERMPLRGFTEFDIRTMLSHPRTLMPLPNGRWAVQARLRGKEWRVIVEPDPIERELVVITAYRFGREAR